MDTYTSLDLYGDRFEHLVVTKMAQHLSVTQPSELMVSVGVDLVDHVTLKTTAHLTSEGLAATATGSAFIVIDGIDPAGTEQSGNFDVIRDAFRAMAPYERLVGGRPLEDVAIYLSDHSFMDFADNGIAAGPPTRLGGTPFPHVLAARGAARALTEAHLPFGVITESDLDLLADYRVLVLPDVSRMTGREVEAVRGYVAGGGRLYASGYTSLVEVTSVQHPDFMLADVFGATFAGEEDRRVAFLTPATDEVREAIWPQPAVSEPYNEEWGVPYAAKPLCSSPRADATEGTVLGNLTLPYGGPAWGSVADQSWASIHSAPPWERTEHAALVHHAFGEGEAVYSTFVLERAQPPANRSLFVTLVRELLGQVPTVSATARSSVWINAYDQEDEARVLVSLQQYGVEQPAPPDRATVSVRPPAGRTFTGAIEGPGARVLATHVEGDTFVIEVELGAELSFVLAPYA